MKIPDGIGHIGEEEYVNELALIGNVIVTCDNCMEKEFVLKGGMEALLKDFDQLFICPDCELHE